VSFDVYVQSFQHGEFAGITRQRIRTAFGLHLTEAEPDFWQLRYDEANSCDLHLTADDVDPTMVRGFTIHRPCADLRLWDALASVLSSGDVVLYFPGARAPLVARASVGQHLPPDMIEALGHPVVVTSGSEIQHEIDAA
jgi:hypothetical protein